MRGLLLLAALLLAPRAPGARYAVDCPAPCDGAHCGPARCARTVLDDCGCCRVCAAGRGETCYRTVSGMDGVKCGPGLRCHFYHEEDAFGDEYGVCQDCPYGTFGMECRETCQCQSGLCDRATGRCLQLSFYQSPSAKSSPRRLASHAEHDMASGDGHAVREELVRKNAARSPVMKWLNPR